VLALTSVAFFMVSLDALVVVTALPAIHQSIGGAIGTLEWAVNGYGLTFAAGIITAAALGERLGRRRVYVAGLTVFTLASAACAVAPDAGLLIAARAVQGLGAAAVTPLALTILAAAFPGAARGRRRDLRRDQRARGGRRAAGRRRRHPGARLALDLLD
jgi:MFS family permease